RNYASACYLCPVDGLGGLFIEFFGGLYQIPLPRVYRKHESSRSDILDKAVRFRSTSSVTIGSHRVAHDSFSAKSPSQ
ncbi:hypothetical protein L9F63_026920, partial [Diploptera punctata]